MTSNLYGGEPEAAFKSEAMTSGISTAATSPHPETSGYRFVAPCNSTASVWIVERAGVRFAARRSRLSDPELQARLRLRHPHFLGVHDLLEDGDWMWAVLPWCTILRPSMVIGEDAKTGILALISVWCALRDLGLVAFPTSPLLGRSAPGNVVVVSIGPVRRSDGRKDAFVSGWLALIACVGDMWVLGGLAGDAMAVAERLAPHDTSSGIGGAFVAAWTHTSAQPPVPESVSESVSEAPHDSSPQPASPLEVARPPASLRGLSAVASSGVTRVRRTLGFMDDLLGALDTGLRRRAAIRSTAAKRKAGLVSPALVAVFVTAALAATAIILL